MESSRKSLLNYLFDLLSRIARFYIHLDEIQEQFYIDTKASIIDKVYFIDSYKEVLEKFLIMLTEYNNDLSNTELNQKELDHIFSEISQISLTLNDLHKELNHLPRPTEPIELRRFGRVINEQLVILTLPESKKNISIYVNEETGETTFKKDPLYKFKENSVNVILNGFNLTNAGKEIDTFKKKEESNKTIHITIPRIEANNPCHWPSLMHEVAHTVMNDFFIEKSIFDDFKEKLSEEQLSEIENILTRANVLGWLTECWCDLFASVTIGHSFWFSQYSSLLNVQGDSSNRDYPSSIFRLELIKVILQHRFPRSLMKEFDETFSNCEIILLKFDKYEKFKFYDNPEVRNLFQLFRIYFLEHFFIIEAGKIKLQNHALNERFQKIVKYVNEISSERLAKLIENLENGLPIPSIRIHNGPDNIWEEATTIQEILFSAWVYRNCKFKESILKGLLGLYSKMKNRDSFIDSFNSQILNEIKKFDLAILRSIQVQEWVNLLCLNEDTSDIKGELSDGIQNKLLVDFEIKNEIINGNIKIIPLISFRKQLGSTSIDIRLGTSFQIFFPNQHGIIDFTDEKTFKDSISNSQKVNLDFLQEITITPGQFILGHSMEYIKLHDTISADLDGRSSFARLGIEIHMTAGFIHPGFDGVLTFEIFNAGPNAVKLYPGLRMGQLRFNKVSKPAKPYSKKHSAKYSGLLEHRYSLQGLDYEVGRLQEEMFRIKYRNTN